MAEKSIDIDRIREGLNRHKLAGWMFIDFRHSDPFCVSVLGLDPAAHMTRRWVYFIPASGEPIKIVHAIETGVLASLPGRTVIYRGWRELHRELEAALPKGGRVAMQYSPRNAIPTIAKVDGGTIELIRSFGVEVVSSADLVQEFEAVLSGDQFQSHLDAGVFIGALVDETFAEIGTRIRTAGQTTEFEIQQFMLERYRAAGLTSDFPPVVAAGPNSALPHYGPEKGSSAAIRAGDFVLIDTWAKRADDPRAVYFDITWTAFAGGRVPEEIASVFEVVAAARDRAIEFITEARRAGRLLRGGEVDDVCRGVIEAAGYGRNFLHRTGHSIYTEVHGNGANIDNLEIEEQRQLIPGTLFSIEPGIYLPGKFGIRSEVNVYLAADETIVTGRAAQREVVRIEV